MHWSYFRPLWCVWHKHRICQFVMHRIVEQINPFTHGFSQDPSEPPESWGDSLVHLDELVQLVAFNNYSWIYRFRCLGPKNFCSQIYALLNDKSTIYKIVWILEDIWGLLGLLGDFWYLAVCPVKERIHKCSNFVFFVHTIIFLKKILNILVIIPYLSNQEPRRALQYFLFEINKDGTFLKSLPFAYYNFQ